ncbi:glycine betaine/L-proline ABC transporter ATP-binding protein [Hyphomicrobium sp.]|uniref:quaternary amine ABC transporter ATP-binding protein n=1 Tax=Hyphomicrobium sp. TaxID=82 RepID=UPI001D8366FE|nr:betaine/proline/choline family ABC transporter ATP-binding protein [Hyphomicrobium sp.]MBY0558815.1 betaine/proline/choline family ABC transporter ATP-binding protein [Hyphomicrobium sp.]
MSARGTTVHTKIRCRNLWKTFGSEATSQLRRTLHETGDASEALHALKASGHLVAVADASFEVAEGEILVIMGLSGSGKSTLIRCLSRLVEPSAGEVTFDGLDLLKLSHRELIEIRRHKMGMVFQSFGLLPHFNVLENVAFPLRIQGVSKVERENRAREMIGLVGLQGRETAFPRELSGGQQQRVGIARSLAVGPDLWFLDEPFSALDPLIRRQMQEEFLRLQKLLKKTIIFITHDFSEALKLADRIIVMRDGRIVQIGRPSEIVLAPADEYVAKFASEVPLTKVLSAADVLEPLESTNGISNPAPLSASAEELIARFSETDTVFIADDAGLHGQVTSAGLLRAISRISSQIRTEGGI